MGIKEKIIKIKVNEQNNYNRIDKLLRKELDEIRLSSIYRLLRNKKILKNGKIVKDPSEPIDLGDVIEVKLPLEEQKAEFLKRDLSEKRKLTPRKISLEIIYEDEGILTLNKPAGISVHPGGSSAKTTLLEGLMHYGTAKGFKIYPVHRLDRDTSGVIIFAKTLEMSQQLSELFRKNELEKKYLLLCEGVIKAPLKIDRELDGKKALTLVLKSFPVNIKGKLFTYCLVKIKTGRKHQIRRHFSMTNNPLAGDYEYGNYETNSILKNLGLKRTFLHCAEIGMIHPQTQKEKTFTAALPADLENFLKVCGATSNTLFTE